MFPKLQFPILCKILQNLQNACRFVLPVLSTSALYSSRARSAIRFRTYTMKMCTPSSCSNPDHILQATAFIATLAMPLSCAEWMLLMSLVPDLFCADQK